MSIADRGRRALRRMTPQASLDAVEGRLARLADRVGSQTEVQRRQRDRIRAQAERLRSQAERIKELENVVRTVEATNGLLQQQLSTVEVRLDRLDARTEPAPGSTPAEREEARKLLDEVREEHRRIRTRFAVVTRYEERIRRLENVLEPTPDP